MISVTLQMFVHFLLLTGCIDGMQMVVKSEIIMTLR